MPGSGTRSFVCATGRRRTAPNRITGGTTTLPRCLRFVKTSVPPAPPLLQAVPHTAIAADRVAQAEDVARLGEPIHELIALLDMKVRVLKRELRYCSTEGVGRFYRTDAPIGVDEHCVRRSSREIRFEEVPEASVVDDALRAVDDDHRCQRDREPRRISPCSLKTLERRI